MMKRKTNLSPWRVPAAAFALVGGLILLGTAQYITLNEFMNLDFTFDPDITRRLVELLASRVSAINQCFY